MKESDRQRDWNCFREKGITRERERQKEMYRKTGA